MAAMLPGMEAVRYPDWASLLERWWRDAPEGTVLALDEFPYLAKASPELPSVLQRLIDQNRSRRLHLVLCGSSQRMMQGLVLDASAPLYGRAREVIEVKPLGASWLGVGLSLSRPSRILEAFAIWGGVPRYWDLAGGRRSTWESVEELVLDPMGVLHNEPRRLLMDDMRDTAQASSILSLVGAGCSRMSEIAGEAGQTGYLADAAHATADGGEPGASRDSLRRT
jgi:AAA+ ATPase superfamily predicted ATPase